ncbi:MAG: hypothetical protein JO165_00335 [Candidatus Eremiobacteraeota bacterium]|nr:hypothetical protein [Candidatus Eremiobacteraeota bacterium]
MLRTRPYFFAFAALALLVIIAGGVSVRAAVTTTGLQTYQGMSPMQLLARVRRQFRTHRPPPPYITYELERKQNTEYGYPDYPNSYTSHYWCRSLDRACLKRRVFRDDTYGDLSFERAAFNEPWDPGPPTADVFEPAPVHPHTMAFVPTPEPSYGPEPVIATVRAIGEFDYTVTNVSLEAGLLHLSVRPRRDPDRNRLREIYADAKTFELRKIVATDKLFVSGDDAGKGVYGVLFTVSFGELRGVPILTDIHGVVGDNYSGDGQIIDYHFRDVKFPSALPEWYFDARSYRQHVADAPGDL